MIVAFYFRVGPTGGPHELVAVAPRRYPITGAARVEADRGDRVPADLEPCGIEHACNLCGARTLEATPDYQGDDWLDQFSRLQCEQQPVEQWWPSRELPELDRRDGPGAGAELVERIGHVELCPSCHRRHGDVEDWPDALLVDAVCSQQHPVNQGHDFRARVGRPGMLAQIDAVLDDRGNIETQREGGRQDDPGACDRVLIIEDDCHAVGPLSDRCLVHHAGDLLCGTPDAATSV